MVIWCTLEPNELIVPVVPLMVAEPELNETVPKLASGRIPPLEEGASAIHSADECWAPLTLEDLLNEAPVVVSFMVTVKDLPVELASADMWSPAWTVIPL